jgi:hypothetical protein
MALFCRTYQRFCYVLSVQEGSTGSAVFPRLLPAHSGQVTPERTSEPWSSSLHWRSQPARCRISQATRWRCFPVSGRLLPYRRLSSLGQSRAHVPRDAQSSKISSCLITGGLLGNFMLCLIDSHCVTGADSGDLKIFWSRIRIQAVLLKDYIKTQVSKT